VCAGAQGSETGEEVDEFPIPKNGIEVAPWLNNHAFPMYAPSLVCVPRNSSDFKRFPAWAGQKVFKRHHLHYAAFFETDIEYT
jgi:hypothetical protein